MQLVSLILIRWRVIYLVDSAIQRLNNWGLDFTILVYVFLFSVYGQYNAPLRPRSRDYRRKVPGHKVKQVQINEIPLGLFHFTEAMVSSSDSECTVWSLSCVMGPLQNTVTNWYKNTLLDGKRQRRARKTKRLHQTKSSYPFFPHSRCVVCHPARCSKDQLSYDGTSRYKR